MISCLPNISLSQVFDNHIQTISVDISDVLIFLHPDISISIGPINLISVRPYSLCLPSTVSVHVLGLVYKPQCFCNMLARVAKAVILHTAVRDTAVHASLRVDFSEEEGELPKATQASYVFCS